MRILITGDSHTGALNRGLVALRAAPDRVQPALPNIRIRPLGGGHLLPTPFFEDAGDYARIVNPEYQRMFAQLPPKSDPNAPATQAIGLSMPLWPMRVVHKMVWGRCTLAERIGSRTPVSRAAFRHAVLADQKYVLALAALLQRQGLLVFAVSPPGLFADHATLRHLAPAHVLHIFNSYRAIMIDQLKQHNIPIVDIPLHCLGADGFMRPEFRHEDPKDQHHANAAFGRLILESVARQITPALHDQTARVRTP